MKRLPRQALVIFFRNPARTRARSRGDSRLSRGKPQGASNAIGDQPGRGGLAGRRTPSADASLLRRTLRAVTKRWYASEHTATPAIHAKSGPMKNSTTAHAARDRAAAYLSGGRSKRTPAAIDSTYVAMNDEVDSGSRAAIPQSAAYAPAAARAHRAPRAARARRGVPDADATPSQAGSCPRRPSAKMRRLKPAV